MFRKPIKLVLLVYLIAALSGCATTTDRGRLSDIKHAYLVNNASLLVCLDGEILGKAGEYHIQIPLNGTFLHPSQAIQYFEPVYSGSEHGIPQFRIPQSLITNGCNSKRVAAEGISVPIVRDRGIPAPVIVGGRNGQYSRSEGEQNRASMNAAAMLYINSLNALDRNAGTVYVVLKDGKILTNFVYASERSLYGGNKAISLALPSRDLIDVGPTVLNVLVSPATIMVAGGLALSAIEHSSSSPSEQRVKPEEKPLPAWVPGPLDPRLEGKWRMTEHPAIYRPNGSPYPLEHEVCAFEVAEDRMVSVCAGWFGYRSRQTLQYRLLEPGKYEFQVVEDSDRLSPLVGRRGTADYRLEDEKLVLTTFLYSPGTGRTQKKTSTYIRDRPQTTQ